MEIILVIAVAFFIASLLKGKKSSQAKQSNVRHTQTVRHQLDQSAQPKPPGLDATELEVRGESFYKPAIRRALDGEASRKVTGMLVAEPTNPHDSNAVKVVVAGETVGYIAREDTYLFHQHGKRTVVVPLTLTDHSSRGFYSVVIGDAPGITANQLDYLEDLLDETGETLDDLEGLTQAQASAEIDRLIAVRDGR